MRRLSPVVPTRQDHGTYLDIVTAPQAQGPLGPLGPMVQGHLMTAEIRGVDLIRSQAPKMNKHEVPFYYGSLANNTTKGGDFSGSAWRQSNGTNPQPTSILEEACAVMLEEHVDVVAGDFNGVAWRRDNSSSISIIEEAFADCALSMPPGHTPLWGPGAFHGEWADVCGFAKPPNSYEPRGHHEQRVLLKGPALTRLTKRKAGATMKAPAHFHPCRPYEASCFHKQRT